jgi:protein phosphatase
MKHLIVAVRSDRGKQRARNEDRAAAVKIPGAPSPGVVALVCDGMGGEAGGEIASTVATEAIVSALSASWAAASTEEALVGSVQEASRRVKEIANNDPRYARMGTTATVAAFADGALVCAQVGDSRAYLLRDGRLEQVTRDQSLVELLRAQGVDVENTDVPTNVILQAVGSSTRLEVVVTKTELRDGDVIMLCSDGVSGVLSNAAIERVLATHLDPSEAAERLVTEANEAGGPDNITCVVARVTAS